MASSDTVRRYTTTQRHNRCSNPTVWRTTWKPLPRTARQSRATVPTRGPSARPSGGRSLPPPSGVRRGPRPATGRTRRHRGDGGLSEVVQVHWSSSWRIRQRTGMAAGSHGFTGQTPAQPEGTRGWGIGEDRGVAASIGMHRPGTVCRGGFAAAAETRHPRGRALAGGAEYGRDRVQGPGDQGVVGPDASLVAGEDARVGQDLEVVRDGRLAQTE